MSVPFSWRRFLVLKLPCFLQPLTQRSLPAEEGPVFCPQMGMAMLTALGKLRIINSAQKMTDDNNRTNDAVTVTTFGTTALRQVVGKVLNVRDLT